MALIGGNFDPYRIPCGGIPYYCGVYAHASGSVPAPIYTYNATVPDPAGGPPIPPYERYEAEPGICYTPDCSSQVCLPWLGSGEGNSALLPQYTLASGQVNTAPASFASSGTDTVNFAACHKRGFKNVAARRQWHGMYGWLSPDQSTSSYCPTGSGGCLSGVFNAGLTGYRPYVAAPDQTHYLTFTTALTYASTNTSQLSTVSVAAASSGYATVNPHSGETTSTINTTETDTTSPATGSPYVTANISHGVDSVSGYGFVATVLDGLAMANVSSGFNPLNAGTTLDQEVTNFNNIICQLIADSDPTLGTYTLLPPVTSLNDYASATGSLVYNLGGGNTLTNTVTLSWSRTNTVYTFSYAYSSIYSVIPNDQANTTLDISGTLTLSDPNPAASVYADAVSLLSNWPLNDDALYPWRTDGYESMAPVISRLEFEGESTPLGNGFIGKYVSDYSNPINDSSGNVPFSSGWTPTWSVRPWFDPYANAWNFPYGKDYTTAAATGLVKIFDGSIIGLPNPAGYQGYFQFGAVIWAGCLNTLGTFVWDTVGYGSGIPAYLPQNCTLWLDNIQAYLHPPGAYLAYHDQTPSEEEFVAALWVIKWAEIGETYESINFARPAGTDKFSLDEEQPVYCFGSDGNVLLDQTEGYSQNNLTLTGIWGGSSANGFFNGATTDAGGNLTLGPQVYNLPTGWTDAGGDVGTAFGKLRWPTAPSLLGRVSLQPDSLGTTMTWGVSQPTFGMAWSGGSYTAQEQVDLYDINMTLLASNITATRVDDDTFTVTTASYLTAAFCVIHGASCSPDYWFCDNHPKGDYLAFEWLQDNRTNGEVTRLSGVTDCYGNTPPAGSPSGNYGYAAFTQTQGCLPISPCQPRVVCFSPNGETWANGITYPFPTTFVMDYLYGSIWQGQVVWSITDPFYQIPHNPCGNSLGWSMDDGSCYPDNVTTRFYGFEPQVEARLSVPGGFPSLPSGITLGVLSPVTHTGAGVIYPPAPCGYDSSGNPANMLTPWRVAMNICGSIAGSCRFSYQNWSLSTPPC